MPGDSRTWLDFEDEVFRQIRRWVRGGSSVVCPARATFQRKKSYFSEPRKAHIEFEVAVEAFDAGATEPSLVWVFECKDHGRSGREVEVKDVEVLHSKIDQLGRSRFRASLVTTHGFQPAAEQLARSAGISLFVLRKKLVKVSKFAGDAEDWEEEVVVSSGFTGSGRDLPDGVEWDVALYRGMLDLLPPGPQTTGSPGA